MVLTAIQTKPTWNKQNMQTIATNHGGGCFLNLTFLNFPKFVRPLRTRSFEWAKICALNHGETHSCFKTTLAGSSTLKERGEIPSTIFCVAKLPFNYLGSCSILATIHLYRRYVKRLVLSWTTESQCLDRHDVTQSDKCLPSKSSHEIMRCVFPKWNWGFIAMAMVVTFGSMTKYLRQKRCSQNQTVSWFPYLGHKLRACHLMIQLAHPLVLQQRWCQLTFFLPILPLPVLPFVVSAHAWDLKCGLFRKDMVQIANVTLEGFSRSYSTCCCWSCWNNKCSQWSLRLLRLWHIVVHDFFHLFQKAFLIKLSKDAFNAHHYAWFKTSATLSTCYTHFYFRESCVGKTKFIAASLGPFIHALAQFASTRAARYPTSGFKSSLSSATLNRFSVPKTWKTWKMHPEPTETYSWVKSVFPNVDCQTASSVFSLHIPACAMHVLRQAADAQLAFHPWHEEKAQGPNANVGKIVIHQPCLSSDSCFAYRSWSQHDEDEHNKQSHQVAERQIWSIRWAIPDQVGSIGQWTWPLFSSLVVQQQRSTLPNPPPGAEQLQSMSGCQ